MTLRRLVDILVSLVALIVFAPLLVAIAVVGNIVSFVRHRRTFVLTAGLAGPALICFALYVRFNQFLLYLGFFSLAAASVLNYIANRQCTRC